MAATNKDVKATFTMDMKDKGGDDIYMNLWMKGEPEREVFTALALSLIHIYLRSGLLASSR